MQGVVRRGSQQGNPQEDTYEHQFRYERHAYVGPEGPSYLTPTPVDRKQGDACNYGCCKEDGFL